MGNYWRYDLRCCVCGRFVPPDADSSVRWGHSYESEPADPIWYCGTCAEEAFHVAVKNSGSAAARFWMPPDWAFRADKAKERDLLPKETP